MLAITVPVLAPAAGLSTVRALPTLFDNTKSEMRGTISARKRDPLKTP